jgi:ligand-binding SRPBCC domain-containing protein
MPRVEIETTIHAPRPVVFDLARSIDAHQQSQATRKERAVAGRVSGLIELGESVTWEAVHFGLRQRLTSRISAMERPSYFRDSMVEGAFARFDHDHSFTVQSPEVTVMRDVFDFTSRFGVIGRFADEIFLTRYMTSLLRERNQVLKDLAESGDYRRFVSGG